MCVCVCVRVSESVCVCVCVEIGSIYCIIHNVYVVYMYIL